MAHAAHRRAKPEHHRTGLVAVGSAAAAYLALALLANLHVWSHGVTHTLTNNGPDVDEEVWFLAQTPWALVHGVNPLANNWLNYPAGVDLMDNTAMPLLGVLGWPITFLFGPVATYNVLFDVAFASSGLTFFAMMRRFTPWWPAAFIGGLLYAFSPFMAAVGFGHLFLLANPVAPLVIIVIDRILRTGKGSWWGNGLALGLCLAAQFYISTEVLASMVVLLVSALVVLGVAALLGRWRPNIRRFASSVGAAAAVVALLAGPGAAVALAGPAHISGPAQSPSVLAGLSTDPVGLVLPTTNQRFTYGDTGYAAKLVAERAPDGRITLIDLVENGTYVGVPLLLLLVATAVVLRRRWWVPLSAALGAWALVLSLGSRLHVGGHQTSIPLPFDVLVHLPLVDSSVASRYMEFFWLFAAILLATAVDALYGALRRRGRPVAAVAAALGVAVVALLPLVPSWPYPASAADAPVWFTGAARLLPQGSTVLVYPAASPVDADAMLWQADADLRFKMPGGYAVFAGAGRTATFVSEQSLLRQELADCAVGIRAVVPPAIVRTQLEQWNIDRVAVDPAAEGAGCVAHLLWPALGPPRATGGVWLWDAGRAGTLPGMGDS